MSSIFPHIPVAVLNFSLALSGDILFCEQEAWLSL
jgi:hypothetical protein